MNDKTLIALVGSIEHWRLLTEYPAIEIGQHPPMSTHCDLCKTFHAGAEVICRGCPVREATGCQLCRESPYEAALSAYQEFQAALAEGPTTRIEEAQREFVTAAKREHAFLTGLLPNDEALRALVASIEHWRLLVDYPLQEMNVRKPTGEHCPLCKVYAVAGRACEGCPVANYTKLKYCNGSPYSRAHSAFCDLEKAVCEKCDIQAKEDRFRARALEMLVFLRTLLPNVNPQPKVEEPKVEEPTLCPTCGEPLKPKVKPAPEPKRARMWSIPANISDAARRGCIRRVDIKETYAGSCKYYLKIYPEGYGEDPKPIWFCSWDDGSPPELDEGYGYFEVTMAFGLARILTGQDFRYPAEQYEITTKTGQ